MACLPLCGVRGGSRGLVGWLIFGDRDVEVENFQYAFWQRLLVFLHGVGAASLRIWRSLSVRDIVVLDLVAPAALRYRILEPARRSRGADSDTRN